MKTAKLLLGAGLISAALGASAATYDIGLLTGLYINNSTVSGVIDDKYSFDILSSTSVASASGYVTTSFTLPTGTLSILDISNFSVKLYNSANSLLGTATKDSGGNFVLNYGPLAAANDYYFNVTGKATGVGGGNYTFTLAPVPEPESYAMLLAGLGIMGFVARRRQKSN